MMNENGVHQGGFGFSGNDGMGMGRVADVVEQFLEPGQTFDEALVRSGMDWNDALDFSAIYRKGITFQRPEIIMYALHALMSHAGDNRAARHEALAAATHSMAYGMIQQRPQARQGLFSRLKRKANTDGVTNDADSV